METLPIPAFRELELLHCDFRAELVVCEVSSDYWSFAPEPEPEIATVEDDSVGMELADECDCPYHYYLSLLPPPPPIQLSLADHYANRLRQILWQ